jgi:hypothetical protein
VEAASCANAENSRKEFGRAAGRRFRAEAAEESALRVLLAFVFLVLLGCGSNRPPCPAPKGGIHLREKAHRSGQH